jgi:hypothetical protein
MSTRSRAEVAPKMKWAFAAKKTMTTLFSAAKKLIELDIRPRARKYNEPHFVQSAFADFKKRYMSFERRNPRSHVCVDIENSIYSIFQNATPTFFAQHKPR